MIIDDEQFVLCHSALHLFMLVLDYRSCAQILPSLSIVDVEHRLIELLKSFNSKSCQLVLGAGAVKLGRIRTITAKTLALTCRCLQFVKVLLPNIKRHFHQLEVRHSRFHSLLQSLNFFSIIESSRLFFIDFIEFINKTI